MTWEELTTIPRLAERDLTTITPDGRFSRGRVTALALEDGKLRIQLAWNVMPDRDGGWVRTWSQHLVFPRPGESPTRISADSFIFREATTIYLIGVPGDNLNP